MTREARVLSKQSFAMLANLSEAAVFFMVGAACTVYFADVHVTLLAATLLGALVAWDIPTCLAVPRLRKPDVLVHHLAMAATALVGSVYLPTHYGLYYMG